MHNSDPTPQGVENRNTLLVYPCKMLRQRWCLDISADKQYKLICEEGSF
jgi:hypothetical protein